MNKKQLRTYYKNLRNILTFEEKEQRSLAIANQLLNLDIWSKTYYHFFLPITELSEVNTEYILQILMGKDKEIIVSKTDFDNLEMIHYLLTENTRIKKNTYNIPEPVNGIEVSANKIEVVFVPLLAFDQHGNRVGYGRGFYDKFLEKCTPGVIKVGVSFFEAETAIDDAYELDIPLDFCVTPNKIYTFGNS
ncbi:MAG TPA: 5-formyltetrahydrofolate cyclo-ligase [Flavobacterium sp.]|nr:5-formyltetrahydrofolate cyclo-ligase [Flavobacterium sp.]